MKLTTLRKLANFFGTTLDFWANDKPFDTTGGDNELSELAKQYVMLSDKDRQLVKNLVNSLAEKNTQR